MSNRIKQVRQEVDPEVFIVATGTEEDSEIGHINSLVAKNFLSLPFNTSLELDQKESLDNKEDSVLTDDNEKYPSLSLLSRSLANKEDVDESILRTTDIVDRLDSNRSDLPLSANRGRSLDLSVEELRSKPQFIEVVGSREIDDNDNNNILSVNSNLDVDLSVLFQKLSNPNNFEFTVLRIGTGKVFVDFDKPSHVNGQIGSKIQVFDRYSWIKFKYEPNLGSWIGWGDTHEKFKNPTPVEVKGIYFGTTEEVERTADILRFDGDSGFFLEDGENENEVNIRLGSHFKTIKVDNEENIIASGEDTLEVTSGKGIAFSTYPSENRINISLDEDGSDLLKKKSSIFVIDVQPVNDNDTVTKSVVKDSIDIVESFESTTNNILLTIEFDGGDEYRGIYTANGVNFDSYQRLSARYFQASVQLTLNQNDNQIRIEGNNASTSITYTLFNPPQVTNFEFKSNSYPSGQTELKLLISQLYLASYLMSILKTPIPLK